MSLVPWNPFRELESFRRQMNSMFDRLPKYYAVKNTFPKINIYQTDNEVILKAEIPGIPKENVDVTIEGNKVRLRGHTDRSAEFRDQNVYRSERYYGGFARTVLLPSGVESDKARIESKDGELSIVFPKKTAFRTTS